MNNCREYTIQNVDQIDEMRRYYDRAVRIRSNHSEAFRNESDPMYHNIRYQVYRNFEQMMQVVVPDYTLPPNYDGGFPTIHAECRGFSSSRRHFVPPSVANYIPSERFSFSLTFTGVTIEHVGINTRTVNNNGSHLISLQ
jgi:hypothetical protein